MVDATDTSIGSLYSVSPKNFSATLPVKFRFLCMWFGGPSLETPRSIICRLPKSKGLTFRCLTSRRADIVNAMGFWLLISERKWRNRLPQSSWGCHRSLPQQSMNFLLGNETAPCECLSLAALQVNTRAITWLRIIQTLNKRLNPVRSTTVYLVSLRSRDPWGCEFPQRALVWKLMPKKRHGGQISIIWLVVCDPAWKRCQGLIPSK